MCIVSICIIFRSSVSIVRLDGALCVCVCVWVGGGACVSCVCMYVIYQHMDGQIHDHPVGQAFPGMNVGRLFAYMYKI